MATSGTIAKGTAKPAAKADQPLSLNEVLWVFAQRGSWPGSLAIALSLAKQYPTVAALTKYVDSHVRGGTLTSTPSWVIKALAPQMGNQVAWLKVPQLVPTLLNSAANNWTAAKTQAALEALPWWQNTPQQAKQWMVTSVADRQVMRDQAASDLAKEYTSLYGVAMDPAKMLADPNLDKVASGQISVQEWTDLQRQTEQYKQRYPGEAARQAAGLPVIDETQYRAIEENYKQTLAQHGMDPTYFDKPQDFTSLFTKDIDPTEFGKRLDAYKTVSSIYSPFMRQAFEQHAGITGLSNTDLYGVISGQRPDLVNAYTQKTGTPPPTVSLYELGQAQQQVISQEQAEFGGGGEVTGAVPQQAQKTTQDLTQAI